MTNKEKAYKRYTDAVLKMNTHRLNCNKCIKNLSPNACCRIYVRLYRLTKTLHTKWANLKGPANG